MSTKVYDWLAHHAVVNGDKAAVVDLASGRRLGYRTFDERARRLAAHLRDEAGVGRGDRVSVLAENSTNTYEVQFACAKLGAVFHPLNWRLAVPELDFIVGDAAPTVIVHDEGFAATAGDVAARAGVAHRLCYGDGAGAVPYEQALDAASGDVTMPVDLTHDDTWTLMYTSGTTGRPKGALITHGMTFFNAVNLGMTVALNERAVCLVVLPLFHTAGLNLYANPLFHLGGTALVSRAFDPGETLRLLTDDSQGITHFFGVPANYLFMQQHPDFADADLAGLIAGVGGAPTPRSILEVWLAKGVPLLQGYGMTETSPAVTATTAERALDKVGSAGQPVLHTEVRIVDEEGADAGLDQVGELWVKGPNVTPGYWNRPEATAESITDGWLHTGDAARLDADGFVWIVDRWKDMYISGGENVYPAEVENVLFQLPEVADAAVIGVADARWGEVGQAVIVLHPGSELEPERVIEHCRANLARFKVPTSVRFVDELPRNATGKVLKRVLKDELGGA
jgi:fatty-acyl-CoA synthase